MLIKKQVKNVAAAIDFNEMANIAGSLAAIERRSSYDDFARSSRYCAETLRKLGFSRVERISHRADGRSAAFDCTMPQAWSLDREKRSFLEIVGEPVFGCDATLADSFQRPLSANLWSAPTPEGGITAELVAFDALPPGHWEVAKGKWVLYTPETGPGLVGKVYHDLAEAGIAGLVAAELRNADIMPDDLTWFNGNGFCGWYLVKGEKRFPTFSIAPRQALALRSALNSRKIELHGEMNCRVYDGEIDTVTAVIPGESDEEIALFAHIYEPFVSDDALGFAHLAEFGAQLLRRQVRLRRTLRVVFSMELYGFAAYLREHGDKILFAANFDGLPYLENRDLIVRRTPFFAAGFTDWFVPDFLRRALPEEKIVPEEASLSDDTFCADPYFGRGGIPVFWIHPDCDRGHHNTGYLFQPDWAAIRTQMPAVDALLETLLCLKELPDYSRRAAAELAAAGRKILADRRLAPAEKAVWLDAEYRRQTGRLHSVKAFTGQKADPGALVAVRTKLENAVSRLPEHEFTAAEYHAMHMVVAAGPHGYPFSLSRVPADRRRPVRIPRMVWPLLDGRRTLWECVRLADAEQNRPTPAPRFQAIIDDLQYVARYGYAAITKREPELKVADFAAALRQLGVCRGMKLVVHSTVSALGRVAEGPEALCRELQSAVGENGVLMMPSFTFQVYLPGKRGAVFDVRETPSKTGVLTETFRRMPGVVRSMDPCHAFCVWGNNARYYVEAHHLVPTVDPRESPLARLMRNGGYVLTIASVSAVTLMHLVESEFGAHCCGKRAEEYDTILPDGRPVRTRAWSWRRFTCKECPASRGEEIVALMRKSGRLREVKLNQARLLLFPMELYWRVYRSLMEKHCRDLSRPRRVETSVPSDWDEKKRALRKNTTAYTGEWMPC